MTQSAAELDDFFYLPAEEFFFAQKEAITYADVSLLPRSSDVLPVDTDPTTHLTENIVLSMPVLTADMDTVTNGEMAAAAAREGAMGIIHSNFQPEQQLKEVDRVKHSMHGVIDDPITVFPEQYVGDVLALIQERGFKFSTFPVVDKTGILIGLLSSDVIKERHKTQKICDVMKPREEIRTVPESEMKENSIQRAERFFTENIGINKLLIVDIEGKLKGLVTASDIERITRESTSLLKPTYDEKHRLRVGATLYLFRKTDGQLDRDRIIAHAGALVDRGVDLVALSSAHGHSKSMIEAVAMIRDAFASLPIMAGNVVSAEGVKDLAEAGAKVMKVGVGPGSICTTRIETGVGISQMTALFVTSKIARKLGVTTIADGGITCPGDMVKALTRADGIMAGSIFAGCTEAPGDIIELDGKKFKKYRGMGSDEAMRDGSAARYGHSQQDKTRKITPEGIVGKKRYIGPVADVMARYRGGIQSGMGYVGARNLLDLRELARFVRVSPGGQIEARPHDMD